MGFLNMSICIRIFAQFEPRISLQPLEKVLFIIVIAVCTQYCFWDLVLKKLAAFNHRLIINRITGWHQVLASPVNLGKYNIV